MTNYEKRATYSPENTVHVPVFRHLVSELMVSGSSHYMATTQ